MDKDDWRYLPVLGKPFAVGAWREGEVTATRQSDGRQVFTKWEPLRGRAEPVELVIRGLEGRPIVADEVRRFLGPVLAGSRAALLSSATFIAEASTKVPDLGGVDPDLLRAGPRRGRRLGDDHLRDVAEVYRQAWDGGIEIDGEMVVSVNEAVRKAFKLSTGGAAKRIMAARKAGFLDGIGPRP